MRKGNVVNAAVEFANESVANSAEEVPIRGYRRLAEETVTIKGRTHHFVLLQMEIGPAAELMTRSLEYSIERFGRTCPEWKKSITGASSTEPSTGSLPIPCRNRWK